MSTGAKVGLAIGGLAVGGGLVAVLLSGNKVDMHFHWGPDGALVFDNESKAFALATERGRSGPTFKDANDYILKLRISLVISAHFKGIPPASLPAVLRLCYAYLLGAVAGKKITPNQAAQVAAILRAEALAQGGSDQLLEKWGAP